MAVIFVGEDLDVMVELCDRIMVLCGGHCNGIVDARSATKDQIGLLMTSYAGVTDAVDGDVSSSENVSVNVSNEETFEKE